MVKPTAIAVDADPQIAAMIRFGTGFQPFLDQVHNLLGVLPPVLSHPRQENPVTSPRSSLNSEQEAADLNRLIASARDAVAQVIFGQDQVIEESLITLLAGVTPC